MGFSVLDNFARGVLVILISKYGIAVFSGPVGYGVLPFWKVLKLNIILQDFKRISSLSQSLIGKR